MPAETLNCPMCGAAASTDSPKCEHCGARLATIACPSCFGMMFIGEKFCSHCGAKADRTETADDKHEFCPRCRLEMTPVLIGKTHLEECMKCEGIWADADSLQQICADREEQAAVLGMATAQPTPNTDALTPVHYVPCPVCGELMNRVNFAHCSNVVVNVCNKHGTWFDRDQLHRVVEFIRAGGLEKERAREIQELNDSRNRSRSADVAGAWTEPIVTPHYNTNADLAELGVSALAWAIGALLRK